MNYFKTLAIFAVAGLAFGSDWTLAQDAPGDDLEITMTLMPQDGELPEAVTRELTLPVFPEGDENEGEPIASQQGVDNSAAGLEIANQARADGRAFGQAAAEAAQDNRENLGRGSPPNLEDLIPGDLPDNVPGDVPGPPDQLPGPPDNLPGPP